VIGRWVIVKFAGTKVTSYFAFVRLPIVIAYVPTFSPDTRDNEPDKESPTTREPEVIV